MTAEESNKSKKEQSPSKGVSIHGRGEGHPSKVAAMAALT
jgi:hypothetical protein